MHAGHREAHDAGGGKLLPDPVLAEREPQGSRRGGDRNRHRKGHHRQAVGETS
jgi:hypothetical protein